MLGVSGIDFRTIDLGELERTAASSGTFDHGMVSQKLTDLMRRLRARIGLLPAWAIVLPLRVLVVFDAPLSRMLRYARLSVALCAVGSPSE